MRNILNSEVSQNRTVSIIVSLYIFSIYFLYVYDVAVIVNFFLLCLSIISVMILFGFFSRSGFVLEFGFNFYFLSLFLFFFLSTALFSGFFYLDKAIVLCANVFIFLLLRYFLFVSRTNVSKLILIPLFFIFLHVLFQLVINDNTDFFSGGSRNVISIFSVMLLSVYIYFFRELKFFVLFLSLIGLVISILSISRSATLSSSLLLVGCIFNFISNKKNSLRLLFCFFIILGIILFFLELDSLFSLFPDLEIINRFYSQSFNDLGRELVLQCYISKYNYYSVLGGLEVFGDNHCGYLAIGAYNTHNSFIQLYSRFGSMFFLVISLVLYSLFKSLIYNRMLVFFCILAFILRMYTDDVAFVGYFDWILFILICDVLSLRENCCDKSLVCE